MGERGLTKKAVSDIPEGFFFAIFEIHAKQPFQLSLGGRVCHHVIFPSQEIVQGDLRSIILSAINLTGSDAVTKHLGHITLGHGNRRYGSGWCTQLIIGPIFKMILVSSLMVKSGSRIAMIVSLGIVGTAGSLIITCTGKKFCGRIFGKIMKKPLAI